MHDDLSGIIVETETCKTWVMFFVINTEGIVPFSNFVVCTTIESSCIWIIIVRHSFPSYSHVVTIYLHMVDMNVHWVTFRCSSGSEERPFLYLSERSLVVSFSSMEYFVVEYGLHLHPVSSFKSKNLSLTFPSFNITCPGYQIFQVLRTWRNPWCFGCFVRIWCSNGGRSIYNIEESKNWNLIGFSRHLVMFISCVFLGQFHSSVCGTFHCKVNTTSSVTVEISWFFRVTWARYRRTVNTIISSNQNFTRQVTSSHTISLEEFNDIHTSTVRYNIVYNNVVPFITDHSNMFSSLVVDTRVASGEIICSFFSVWASSILNSQST